MIHFEDAYGHYFPFRQCIVQSLSSQSSNGVSGLLRVCGIESAADEIDISPQLIDIDRIALWH